jgi:hypothetical protein
MTFTFDQERWIAKADQQGQIIKSTGGVSFRSSWCGRTLKNRANLPQWQKDYLDKIGFPRSTGENKLKKKNFRIAKKVDDVTIALADAEKDGSTLTRTLILRAHNAYKDGITSKTLTLGVADSTKYSSAECEDSTKYSSAECEDVMLDEFSNFHTTSSDFTPTDEVLTESFTLCPPLPGEDTMLNDGDFFYTEEEWAAIEGI